MASNKLGTFEELILKKKTGDTIFIQEFDQKGFHELKSRLSRLLTEDKKIKPNYWTKFYQIAIVMLFIWYGLMIGLTVLR